MSDDTIGPTATAELAHEALIRSWSRLATWVDSDAAFQRWLVTMEDRVAENELLPEARINEAERWLTERPNDIPTEIREMIERSRTLLLQRTAELEELEKARTAARTARHQLRLRLAVVLTVMLLVVGVLGVFTYLSHRNAQQRAELAQAAAILSYNPVESVRQAVDAYQISANDEARSAVLTAASSPRSQVVAGPPGSKPRTVSGTASTPMTVIGMVSTPDSRHVVAYDKSGSIQVIGDNGAVERQTTVSGLRGAVTPVASTISLPAVSTAAVAPDASRVALETDLGTVAVIDTGTGRHTDITSTADSTPTIVRWIGSATNGLVLVVSTSGIATTYNPETGQQVTRFPDTVYDALPLADEQHIVTSGQDGRLRVWDARTATKITESSILNVRVLRRYAQSVVSFSLGENPAIVVWNWQAGPDAIVRYRVDNLDGVRQLVVNEHAQIVITSQDKRVRTFSLVDGSEPVPRSLPPQAGLVNNVAISSDGQWITTAGADGRVLVWFVGHAQSPTGPTYELFGHRGEATQMSYLSAGTVVMSLGDDGTVRRWELPHVPRFEGHTGWVVAMDLSRDRTWLATGPRWSRLHHRPARPDQTPGGRRARQHSTAGSALRSDRSASHPHPGAHR